jgi:hypothetical protein
VKGASSKSTRSPVPFYPLPAGCRPAVHRRPDAGQQSRRAGLVAGVRVAVLRACALYSGPCGAGCPCRRVRRAGPVAPAARWRTPGVRLPGPQSEAGGWSRRGTAPRCAPRLRRRGLPKGPPACPTRQAPPRLARAGGAYGAPHGGGGGGWWWWWWGGGHIHYRPMPAFSCQLSSRSATGLTTRSRPAATSRVATGPERPCGDASGGRAGPRA